MQECSRANNSKPAHAHLRRFTCTPDYDRWKNAFLALLRRHGHDDDGKYDWVVFGVVRNINPMLQCEYGVMGGHTSNKPCCQTYVVIAHTPQQPPQPRLTLPMPMVPPPAAGPTYEDTQYFPPPVAAKTEQDQFKTIENFANSMPIAKNSCTSSNCVRAEQLYAPDPFRTCPLYVLIPLIQLFLRRMKPSCRASCMRPLAITITTVHRQSRTRLINLSTCDVQNGSIRNHGSRGRSFEAIVDAKGT